jgi:hypothetical protein
VVTVVTLAVALAAPTFSIQIENEFPISPIAVLINTTR